MVLKPYKWEKLPTLNWLAGFQPSTVTVDIYGLWVHWLGVHKIDQRMTPKT